MRRILVLALCCLLAFPSVAPSGDAPPAVDSAYQAAVERAEADLRQMESGDERPGGVGLSEWLGIAALAVALAFLLVAMRRMRGGVLFKGQTREMRLLDRMALGRQSSLLLVRLRDKDYWLAETPGGVTLLAQWPAQPPSQTEHSESAKKPF